MTPTATAPSAARKAHNAPAEEIEAKCRQAREAYHLWRAYPVRERVRAVESFWEEVVRRKDELVRVMHEETGKPIAEIETMEITGVGVLLKYFARNAERILADRPAEQPWVLFNKRAYVRQVPRGIIGLITPWNFPLLIPAGDALPSLIAGNAVVIKPSEWTSKTAQFLEQVATEHDPFPKGLLTVLTGDGTVGTTVLERSDMVLFTGSTRTGRRVAQRAAELLKPVVLELGGKHPMIVLRDADVRRASAGALWGGLANCGQICVGVERVLVERPAYGPFCEALTAEFNKLRQGQEAGYDVDLGRMIFPGQVETVQRHLEDARAKGGRIVGGGPSDKELVLKPALILDATQDMLVMQEETFGPLLPVMPVASAEEALDVANRSPLGLAASVWSRDVHRAESLGRHVEAGLIGVNDVLSHYAVASLPFGGFKTSGLGRRHGEEGLRMFTQAQSFMVHEWPAGQPDLWWFPYGAWKTRLLSLITRFS